MIQNMSFSKIIFSVSLGLLVWLGNPVVAQQSLNATNVTEATVVANQYMQALMQGNTEVALGLLIDDEFDSKSKVLSNPSYSGFLQKHYSNAQYKILNAVLVGKGKVAVDVSVIHSNMEKTKFRLWLRKTKSDVLRIFSETQLP